MGNTLAEHVAKPHRDVCVGGCVLVTISLWGPCNCKTFRVGTFVESGDTSSKTCLGVLNWHGASEWFMSMGERVQGCMWFARSHFSGFLKEIHRIKRKHREGDTNTMLPVQSMWTCTRGWKFKRTHTDTNAIKRPVAYRNAWSYISCIDASCCKARLRVMWTCKFLLMCKFKSAMPSTTAKAWGGLNCVFAFSTQTAIISMPPT